MELHQDSELIDRVGTTTEVAAMLGVTPQAVSQYRKTGLPDPRRQILQLLRPDVFGRHHATLEEARER